MHVSEMWRYPVKSMVGETADAIELDALGVVGDRTWAARDLERGGIRGAKKIGPLMRLAAHDLGNGEVEITLPDAATVRTGDSDVHERVSAAIDHPVRLERLRPADDLEHYRRGGPDSDDIMVEMRAIFGREDDEPLPDFTIFPPAIAEFESPPGTYYDAFALMVMTTAALAALGRALPDSNVDVRRFRPSLVIDTGDDGARCVDAGPSRVRLERSSGHARIGDDRIRRTVPALCDGHPRDQRRDSGRPLDPAPHRAGSRPEPRGLRHRRHARSRRARRRVDLALTLVWPRQGLATNVLKIWSAASRSRSSTAWISSRAR